MKFDYYALLSEQTNSQSKIQDRETELTIKYFWAEIKQDKEGKNTTRRHYFKMQSEIKTLNLGLDKLPRSPLLSAWIGIEVNFTLKRPWYSKDDRVFHILDNPIHKERVFGIPFVSASTWKGLIRWACRMQAGLRQHLEEHNGSLKDWKDPDWIIHLFGNEREETQDFTQGALVFYPTWFDRIGFEVINPHSRSKRAGTQPIYYEVVPAGTSGTLFMLYAPLPGVPVKIEKGTVLKNLLFAIEALLTHYGISAKRTSGWGTAQIDHWHFYTSNHPGISAPDLATALSRLETLLSGEK